MSNFQKIAFVFFLVLIGLLVYVEATKPVPVNWYPSYNKNDKIPLGTFVLHDLLKQHFQENLIDVDNPPYLFLQNEASVGTYVFINNYLGFDEVELESLLTWTAQGNTLFLSANSYSKNLLDTLGLDMKNFFFYDRFQTQPVLSLVDKNQKPAASVHIERNLRVSYFNSIDTLTNRVLGFSQAFEEEETSKTPEVNFLKVPFEKGQIFFYNQPEIFTNFILLDSSKNTLSAKVLSYINSDGFIYWDNYYKTGGRVDVSPLHILFKTRSLKWAYYSLLIGVLLFVIFKGKRKQRPVPVLEPLTNKTFEYTQTISGIYRDTKDNRAILRKITAQFLEYIRIKLRVETNTINSHFYNEVASRSNQESSEIKALFETIKKLENQTLIKDIELIELLNKINELKTKIDGK
ncbi:MAG: DUF4350 domain-containing protein [Flavobacteriaceae bacterium]